MKTQLSINEIAEKIGKSVWVKGDVQRIYLNDIGFNTKKMKTTAYIYLVEGEVLVSAFVDCWNQPINWKIQQAEIVKNKAYEILENAINI